MARICPLFSSSEGNCIYISGSSGGLLVDAGVSGKAILSALEDRCIDPSTIHGILVTHSHTDHIKAVKVLGNKLGIPVYATEQTLMDLEVKNMLSPKSEAVAIKDAFDIADIEVTPFATSHDCLGSVGYSFILPDGCKMAVCTDLGIVTDEVRNAISGANAIVIESNHDVTMLKNGPYPPELKARILSDRGHLSNVACASELPSLIKSGTTRFILGHLSQHNNLPNIARSCSEAVLMSSGAKNGRDYILKVAPVSNGEMMYL